MQMYSAHVELDRKRITGAQAEKLHDELEAYRPAVGHSPRGLVDAQISLPAEHLAQASTTAVAVVEAAARATGAPATAVAVEVMTEDEFNARQGWTSAVPVASGIGGADVIGSAEAAQILGVSRQRVLQYVEDGRLASEKIGARARGFRRADVERLAASR